MPQLRTMVEVQPAGMVAMFCANSAPSGWLKCNGAAVSRTTYSDLFAAIGTTFGAGNGSTTFNLPDLRGEFVRCWDDGRGVDPGRGFATAQAAETQQYKSLYVGTNAQGTYVNGPFNGAAWNKSTNSSVYTMQRNNQDWQTNMETRPRNAAILACIKF